MKTVSLYDTVVEKDKEDPFLSFPLKIFSLIVIKLVFLERKHTLVKKLLLIL
jgi:hypothetical protein